MAKKETFGGVFNKLILHEKYIEIKHGGRKRNIPYSAISNVEKPPMLNYIKIHTNDGQEIKFAGGNANKIQAAIIDHMG